MAIPLFDAARHLCEKSDWTLTQLELQKLLYFAQMFHLWRFERPLVNTHFEAWEFGPVSRELYNEVKRFGDRQITAIHQNWRPVPKGTERDILDEVLKRLGHLSGPQLIELTHWEDGAWKKNYVRGARHVVIPRSDMIEEFRARAARSVAQNQGNG